MKPFDQENMEHGVTILFVVALFLFMLVPFMIVGLFRGVISAWVFAWKATED